ncbi:MAG: class B sortase [Ruminococcaceae bacterium]|nr:class B sortase [Oscillospiraceae bacterium]
MSKKQKNEASNASSSLFIESLNRARDEDICPSTREWETSRKRRVYRELTRVIIFVLCAALFISSLYRIVRTLIDYKQAEDFYTEMYDMLDNMNLGSEILIDIPLNRLPSFGTINSPKGEGAASYNKVFTRMKSKILAIKSINSDMYGWIVVPGTDNIDLPVLQTTDNEYYLNHVYTGGYLQAGSVFADYRCSRDTNANFNTVIYAHNMQNGMMFSELIKFLDEEFFRENEYIYLCTETGIYTYRIFSVFKTDYRSGYVETGFPSANDFVKFANDMQEKSMFKREGISFNTDSRIITLSTCTNSTWSDRYCIQGILVDSYNSQEAYN